MVTSILLSEAASCSRPSQLASQVFSSSFLSFFFGVVPVAHVYIRAKAVKVSSFFLCRIHTHIILDFSHCAHALLCVLLPFYPAFFFFSPPFTGPEPRRVPRRHFSRARSRCARHLVLLRPLPVLRVRMAPSDPRPQGVLPHLSAGDWPRYSVLLGG